MISVDSYIGTFDLSGAALETQDKETVAVGKEPFALYGFQVEIPDNWRVEFNPKGSRKKGDIVFQSPQGNRIFVSWGPLDSAQKRFKTLDEQRDSSIARVKKGPDVKSLNVTDSREELIGGHRALISHVSASVKAGFMARNAAEKDLWSVHFYCPNLSRYYVIYSLLRAPDEFENFSSLFNSMAKSFNCHPTQS